MLTRDGRPLVVVDRCVLTFGRVEHIVGENAAFVLTDAFFHEALMATPETEGPKFDAWAKQYADRLFFARYWDHLSREETEPRVCVDPRNIIEESLTASLRDEVPESGLNWGIYSTPAWKRKVQEKQELVESFEHLCSQFAEFTQSQRPNWQKELGSWESQAEFIRQPPLVASFVQEYNKTKQGDEWKTALSTFPDEHAIARWARLVAWYALQRSLGKTKGFANNYFDAEYAFASSYVGRLATSDKGFQDAVSAVFPDVEILSD